LIPKARLFARGKSKADASPPPDVFRGVRPASPDFRGELRENIRRDSQTPRDWRQSSFPDILDARVFHVDFVEKRETIRNFPRIFRDPPGVAAAPREKHLPKLGKTSHILSSSSVMTFMSRPTPRVFARQRYPLFFPPRVFLPDSRRPSTSNFREEWK
jgi:hypothetical protein